MRRSARPSSALAVAVVVVGAAFVQAYATSGRARTSRSRELAYQAQHAHESPAKSNDATSANEASSSEPLASLRDGARTVARSTRRASASATPASTAARTHVTIEAGESTYTELGVETGLLGGLLFVAWSLALLRRLTGAPWLAASFVAVLALGLQTDVIGIPWIAVVVWALAGDAV